MPVPALFRQRGRRFVGLAGFPRPNGSRRQKGKRGTGVRLLRIFERCPQICLRPVSCHTCVLFLGYRVMEGVRYGGAQGSVPAGAAALRSAKSLPTDHRRSSMTSPHWLIRCPTRLDLGEDDLVGSLQVTARLRNRLDAYLTALAGTADAQHVSTSLRAGTTGVMIATGHRHQPGGRVRDRGHRRALRTLPHVDRRVRRRDHQLVALHALH